MVASTDNFVKQKSTSTGTGDFTLSDLSPARRSFNTAFGTGGTDKFQYAIYHQSNNQYEFGTGHLSDTTTLVRDTVEDSSNGDSLVDFTSGDKIVLCDIPAGKYGPALDIDDDDSNESSRLQEIATTNEPSSPIASEPTADKALFDWGNITAIAGVGNIEVLASDTVSSASTLDLKAGLTGSFPYYILMWSGFFPASDGQDLYLRTSDDGTNFESGSSDYSWVYVQRDPTGNKQERNADSDSKIRLGEGGETKTTSAIPGQGKALLRGVEGAERTAIRWESVGNQDDLVRSRFGGGARAAATTDQAYRLLYSGSNISEGRAAIYGVRH